MMKTKLLTIAFALMTVSCSKDLNLNDFGHEWVDLGLSVKWATCNVGASKPEEYGDYFAWGETNPKTIYNWSTYKYCKGSSSTLTKYCTHYYSGMYVVDKAVLDPEDDAAHVNWGGSWRMPTEAEQDELQYSCTWTWTTQNGVKGYLVKSKTNSNSIFLPASGYCEDSSLYGVGSEGDYWSSRLGKNVSVTSLYSLEVCYLGFESGDAKSCRSSRYRGFSVRAICPK